VPPLPYSCEDDKTVYFFDWRHLPLRIHW
jgi:hypothetical protein